MKSSGLKEQWVLCEYSLSQLEEAANCGSFSYTVDERVSRNFEMHKQKLAFLSKNSYTISPHNGDQNKRRVKNCLRKKGLHTGLDCWLGPRCSRGKICSSACRWVLDFFFFLATVSENRWLHHKHFHSQHRSSPRLSFGPSTVFPIPTHDCVATSNTTVKFMVMVWW